MFIDASVLVAIMAAEPGHEGLIRRAMLATSRITSPISVWEAGQALERLRTSGDSSGKSLIEDLLSAMDIAIVDITKEIGVAASDAAMAFGKGRHPASLNMGDCFSYACAKVLGVPLLFKGNDFSKTDIETA